MKFLKLDRPDREALWRELESMPDFLSDTFGGLSSSEAATAAAADAFSPVEQCWHLADLEREGFSVRLRRLLEDSHPLLEDFDGARIARERDYKQKSLADGIAAFRRARLDNLALIQALKPEDWTRQGEQDGVGRVMLCDIPAMMAEHDTAHRKEIAEWLSARRASTRPGADKRA
jgi:DinB superfamily